MSGSAHPGAARRPSAAGRGWARGGLGLLSAAALLGCISIDETVAPPSAAVDGPSVGSGGMVWPAPPETARYQLAEVLIGERSITPAERRRASPVMKALRWVAGVDDASARAKELRRPVAGLTRADGAVLVVDAGHKGVVVFDRAAQELRFWTESAPGVGFDTPVAISQDGRGGYLVTDAELKRVIRLGADGAPLGAFGQGDLRRPTGIAYDPVAKQVYVADTETHEVKIFDAAGKRTGVIGGPGSGAGRFNAPTHLSFQGDTLFVSDTLNARVQAFGRDGRLTLGFGRLGLFVGDLTRPKGVAVGGGGRIYVIESYHDHLLVFDPKGQLLLPIGGTGVELGRFYLPSGVWTDGAGRVYVADMFNGRVVVFQELTELTEG